MSDNAPENVTFTDEEVTSAVLHNLTHMIKRQAKDAAVEVLPVAMGTSLGLPVSKDEMGKALASVMQKLTNAMDLAVVIEKLLPAQFSKEGEEAKAIAKELETHPLILEAAMRLRETSDEKLSRAMRNGR